MSFSSGSYRKEQKFKTTANVCNVSESRLTTIAEAQDRHKLVGVKQVPVHW